MYLTTKANSTRACWGSKLLLKSHCSSKTAFAWPVGLCIQSKNMDKNKSHCSPMPTEQGAKSLHIIKALVIQSQLTFSTHLPSVSPIHFWHFPHITSLRFCTCCLTSFLLSAWHTHLSNRFYLTAAVVRSPLTFQRAKQFLACVLPQRISSHVLRAMSPLDLSFHEGLAPMR